MPNRETRHDRKKRRQEMIAQATRDREVRAAGPEPTSPRGAGAPREAASDTAAKKEVIAAKKGRLPD